MSKPQRIAIPKDFSDATVQINRAFEKIQATISDAGATGGVTPAQLAALQAQLDALRTSPTGVSGPASSATTAGTTVVTDATTITGDGSIGTPVALIAPNGNNATLQITTAESIPDATLTALTFAAGGTPANPVSDTAGFYSSANNTRLTAPTTGIYSLNAIVRWAANSAGQRQILFFKNGVLTANTELAGNTFISTAAGNDPTMSISWQGLLNAGDYVEAYVFQNGTVGPVSVNTQYQTFTIAQAPY